VVAQLARNVDVYRLAGGHRVRLQLQPEGLGGVEVTLRYGASQRLELHVVVERAETGALVEQGWSQLRDALNAQGLSTERMVVSVAGPVPSDAGPATGNGRDGGDWGGGAFGSGLPSSGGHERGDQHRSRHASAAFGQDLSSRPQEPPSAGHEKTSGIDYRV
jgi:hypothetical protein